MKNPQKKDQSWLQPNHKPVFLKTFVEYIKNAKTLWDSTLGLGGHASAYLNYSSGILFASDQDKEMLELAKKRLSLFPPERFKLVYGNFRDDLFPKKKFDIIFADLGISSVHLDYFSRGISYKGSQTLDMRLDKSLGFPLFDFINTASEKEICSILFQYGEEPKARKIAHSIIIARKNSFINKTDQLREIIINSVGKKKEGRYIERNPEARTFQAFRIFINDELRALKKFLTFAPQKLNLGGKLMIISFHSLEDRIVKNRFKELWRIPSEDIRYTFIEGDYKIITKKPLKPSNDELIENYRARSAKLRILKRI